MSDLREQAERMVAERLGLQFATRGELLCDEETGSKFWPYIGVEGKLWREAVRLQVELLTKPMP